MAEQKKEKVPRQKMPEQEAIDRVHNFDEVPYGYTEELAKLEASRCLQCKKPRCVQGCPVSIDIPSFVGLIKQGKFVEAAQKLKETNANLGIVILTGFPDGSNIGQSVSIDVDAYLTKPVDLDDLTSVVNDLVKKQEG